MAFIEQLSIIYYMYVTLRNRIHLNDIFKVPSIRDTCILNDPLDCRGISLCIISLYISLWRLSSLRSVKSKIVPIVLLQLYKIIRLIWIQ